MKNIVTEISILISLYLGLYADNSSKNQPDYQDTWYRLYDVKHHVFDMFYSNEEFWKDEPVIIIVKDDFNGSHGEGIAEGFFSQKKREILISTDKVDINRRIYTDKKTKILLQQRVIAGHTAWDGSLASRGSIRLENKILQTNEALESEFLLSKIYEKPKDQSLDYYFGMSGLCEPILNSIKLANDANETIWQKSVVRYYLPNEELPKEATTSSLHRRYCEFDWKFFSSSGGYVTLMLADNTLLVSDDPLTYIVRLKLEDGSTGKLPNNLKVIDSQKVIEAKKAFLPYLKTIDLVYKQNSTDADYENALRKFAEYFFDQTQGKK